MVCVTPQKLLRESGKYVVLLIQVGVRVCLYVYVRVIGPYVCLSAHPRTVHRFHMNINYFVMRFRKKVSELQLLFVTRDQLFNTCVKIAAKCQVV